MPARRSMSPTGSPAISASSVASPASAPRSRSRALGVPLSAAARQALAADPQAVETILTGGDDFEVVAAVPADHVEALRTEAADAGVALTEIGVVVAGPREARFMAADGSALAFKQAAYSHF